jgi:hypothetical protein
MFALLLEEMQIVKSLQQHIFKVFYNLKFKFSQMLDVDLPDSQ